MVRARPCQLWQDRQRGRRLRVTGRSPPRFDHRGNPEALRQVAFYSDIPAGVDLTRLGREPTLAPRRRHLWVHDL